MFKSYQGKHYQESPKDKCFKIMNYLIIMFVVIGLTLSPVARILSYYVDVDTTINKFEVDETYTIHFDANDGTGTMSDQIMFCSLSENLKKNTFEKSGYEFNGWNTVPGGTGTGYADEESVHNLAAANSSITLYAQWTDETNEAEVIGDKKYPTLQQAINAVRSGGGQKTIKVLKNIELTTAASVGAGKDIILDIQSFKISNKSDSNINIIKNSGTLEIISGTIESTAAYGAIDNESTAKLTINGGQIIAKGERQTIYNNGGIVEVKGSSYLRSDAPDRPTIQNFKPNGRNAGTITISGGTIVSTTTTTKGAVQNDATGTVVITGGTIISNNVMGVDNSGTLIIGVEDEEADISNPVIQGATYGVKTAGNGNVEFYDGIVKGKTHAFNDENYITDKEDYFEIENSTEVIDGDTYETAFLDATDVKVKFDGNGGTPELTSVFIERDTAIGTFPENPTRARYSFDGWFTDPVGGTQITASHIVTAPVTFYAHWTMVEAEVTFDAGYGTSSEASRIVNVGSAIGQLPTATCTNEAFLGWYTDSTGGTRIDENEIITDDITYYAHWDALPVRVTFNPGQGGLVDEPYRDISADTEIGQMPVPTKTNMAFAGWYTDPTGGRRIREDELVTEDVEYYAHWISNPVARIGPVNFESVQLAIRDVRTDNIQTTIILLDDYLESAEVIPNQNILLDLQGHTLYNDGSKKIISIIGTDQRAVVFENSGTLRITNGTISAVTTQAALNNNSTMILDGVTVTNTGTRQAVYNNGGNLLITGNSYLSASTTERATVQGNKPNGKNAGTITIESGTIVSTNTTTKGAVENPATGILNITGGTIISNRAMGVENKGTLNLGTKDGTINSTSPDIQGATYGIKNSGNGTVFNFYDGIAKGITGSINATVTDTEEGATRVDTMDGNYHVTYYE